MTAAARRRAAVAWRGPSAGIAGLLVLTVTLGLGAAVPAARAATPAAAEPDAEAVAALRKASAAAQHTSYRGVQYVSSWSRSGTVSVVLEVRHTASGGSVVEVRRTPFSRGLRYVGSDGQGSAVAPQARNAQVASDEVLDLLQHNYDLHVDRGSGEATSVAGRSCDVVVVRHSDGALAARLWLDRASGLLLRREVSDRTGVLLGAMTFVDVTVEPRGNPTDDSVHAQEWNRSQQDVQRLPSDEEPMAERPVTAPWSEVSAEQAQQMRRRGWELPAKLPGNLMLYDARRSERGEPVLHLAFSDGLSTVSLFQQQGRLDERDMAGWRRESIDGTQVFVMDTIPRRVAWSSDGTVYTMLADAPIGTVRDAVRALPHRGNSEPGMRTRLGRGLSRFGSWLNPFD